MYMYMYAETYAGQESEPCNITLPYKVKLSIRRIN